MNSLQDRVRGSLIGGAIGDALGYPVEFIYSFEGIQAQYGEHGITRLDTNPHGLEAAGQTGKAVVSDDTQMTLYTANGLLNAIKQGIPLKYGICKAYIEWYLIQSGNRSSKFNDCWINEIPELNHRRAPGNTCMSALDLIYRGKEPMNNSKGCGGVMRIAPIPLFSAVENRMSIQDSDLLAGDAAEITHLNPLGFISAALAAHVIYRLATDEIPTADKLESYIHEGMDEMAKLYPQYLSDVNAMGKLCEQAISLAHNGQPDLNNISALGEGWVGDEALAIALYCALRHFDSFEDAMIAAVNHGGDSDSTGAICGNILGAAIGYDAIPLFYKDDLEMCDLILHMADDLYRGEVTPLGTSSEMDFLQKYNVLMDRVKSGDSDAYYKVKALRAELFRETVDIVNQGHYVTVNGKRFDFPDDSDMMRNTTFYEHEITLPNAPQRNEPTIVEVQNIDCLYSGVQLKAQGYNPAVLNMASRRNPGGGVATGAAAQEETLFRRTNLFRSLYQFASYAEQYGVKRSTRYQYPLDRNFGGIYTHDAIYFRESEKNGYALIDDPVSLSFITVAGMNRPDLTADGMIADYHVEPIKNKIRTIFRIGLLHGHDSLVLGALGCGAFRNPPRHVARLFHEVMKEPEFANRYRLIVFAILDDHNAHRSHNPEGNFKPFVDEFA